ncbi:UNVERIFIED_CONTAM: Serine/threonine-protein kinase BLUS1 [Sesamum calycinum]|uniref:Serine/threonine-protein kinase BLUS1 n=1 Tax=Sesamum calycinum TaxID=2727403 RepID=A0AAW2Q447_9LAMI
MDQVEKKQSSSSSPDYEFSMEKSSYEMIHQIGGGLIANVFKATCKSLVVAIKIIDLEKANDEFEPLESKGITQNISHRNMDRRLWVVMPFVDKDPSTEPGNVLIGKNGRIFSADFAYSASFYERRPSSSSNIGSEYWMPPEKLKSAMSDIWSFGITALELGHGRPPLFCLPKSKSLIKKVMPLEALLGEGDESEPIVNALVSSVEEQIERSKDQTAQLEDLIEKWSL